MLKLVLIADIIGSRQASDRNILQRQLKAVLADLNRSNRSLLSPYTITLGDEFQAVFSSPANCFGDAIAILAALYPVQVRFSFGVGEISTDINPEQALGMDGPAFYRARDGMKQLKESGYLFQVNGLESDSNDPQARIASRLCTHSLQLLSVSLQKWRESRFEILLGLMQDLPVKTMSETTGLSEQAVYKNISDGTLKLVRELLDDVSSQIDLMLSSK